MATKRRWMTSVLEESKKPLPKMPWQARKVAVALPSLSGLTRSQGAATA